MSADNLFPTGQPLGIKSYSQLVLAGVDEVGQAVDEAEHHQNIAQRTDADAGIPFSRRAMALGGVPARTARSATEMPLRKRALRRSLPSRLRALPDLGEPITIIHI
ncbi:hypothetical protein GCM10023219_18480 [Stakelama sediminis]|uniref:Uncharacterized protein n=1 Tax=Stakelama sediminis TaxID=463200 RepID=A0A840Z2C0_9SPHN|nr:hypothetical protein [Stakelama sediminis]MBB5719856.1 hypothetical protein [Stakelama sediminis]